VRALNSESEDGPIFANNNFEFAVQGVYKFSLP
jgi:hypothetical protein